MVTAANPLRAGLRLGRMPDPAVIVIFGSTGDLAHRKLLPAVYNLALDRLLPVGFTIVGVGRKPGTDETFRGQVFESLSKFSRRPVEEAVWASFAGGIRYWQMQYDDPAGYQGLSDMLRAIDDERGTSGNRLYYLSTPPSLFTTILDGLGGAGLNREEGNFARVIIEKPFGHDLASARELNADVNRVFQESQVYRIDHYLGKETVQNLLVLRFANGMFEPIWNREYVDHCQITVAETLGVGSRAGYYEESGALRDMVANHMMQLVSLVAMEPPVEFDADSVRDEKVKVLRAIDPISASGPLVRAQYASGWSGGQQVPAYKRESGVSTASKTATYIALRLEVDNWRWAGVPFYLRHGKRLPKRVTEIAVQFKKPPQRLFRDVGDSDIAPNVLVMRIQPDEGISLRFAAKGPGTSLQLRQVTMDFSYEASFDLDPPEAYERLILDCLLGDSTLFIRRDEAEAAWAIYDPLIADWKAEGPAVLPSYEAGTWGPMEADALLGQDGREWRRL